MADSRYLARLGAKLIDLGYEIVPIARGKKFPPIQKWQSVPSTKRQLKAWIEQDRFGGCGIGLRTRLNPGVDLDIPDADFAEHMHRFVRGLVGDAPTRVGRAPKRLLLCRAAEPFRKINATEFLDSEGRKHQVEILGDGEQFVAFAIHPDTGQPYEWTSLDSPLDTASDELPVLTREAGEAIVAEFESQARARGMKPKREIERNRKAGERDKDDPFAEDSQKTDLSLEQLRELLFAIPNEGDHEQDYETWRELGMALWHQTDGSQDGFDLWVEWSAQASKHAEADMQLKWESFDVAGKGRAPATARTIIKYARDYMRKSAVETAVTLKTELEEAKDGETLLKLAERIKTLESDPLTHSQLIAAFNTANKRITGQRLPTAEVRKLLRPERTVSQELPEWLKGWCYITHADEFFHPSTGAVMSQTAFNSAYGRRLLTRQEIAEGQAHPAILPAHFALHRAQIPVVDNRVYMPSIERDGLEEDSTAPFTFKMNGRLFVNTYSGLMVPEVPEKLTKQQNADVQTVRNHFSHLIESPIETRTLLDYFAYIVQSRRRVNWAPVLQGTEGDGKSFFFRLMGAVLGPDNVTTLNAPTLSEKFSPWAEGSMFCVIEEIRLHGKNRYDVLDAIKPFVTNETVQIRRMNTNHYKVPNTVSYFMTTNHRDALPINDSSRRYFVLQSRFQTGEQLARFLKTDPFYYDRLFQAVERSPGAIRKMLLEHEISSSFQPQGHAPHTQARRDMIELTKSDELAALEEMFADSRRWDMTRELLNATDLAEVMSSYDVELPYGRALHRMLATAGFSPLGKIRIDNKLARFWSQQPGLFRFPDGATNTDAIRTYLFDNL